MSPIYSFAVLVLSTLLSLTYGQSIPERNGIINATLLQNMNNFPHQVGIYNSNNYYCSGSILTSKWILTADSCVGYDNNATLTLMFRRINLNISRPLENNAYTIQVNMKSVQRHGNLNLALIELSTTLNFNIEVAPVALYMDSNANLTGVQAVMAGIKQNTTQEAYGTFVILSNNQCGYGENMLCTLGWQNSSTVPCFGVQGGGLLVNWPNKPSLIGVFSAPTSCLSYIKADYTRINFSTITWMENVIGKHLKIDGYF